MKTFLSRYSDVIYAVFRFMTGALFIVHGTQKLFAYPDEARKTAQAFSLSWFAGMIEVVCGTAVAIGFLGAWAAFLASGTMAFAYFMRHAGDGFFPTVNKGEPAVLFCFAFLLIAAMGSGNYSVDSLLRRKR